MVTHTARSQIVSLLRTVVVVSYLVYAPYYLYWRLGTFNPDALFFSWTVWAAELFGVATAFLHFFMVERLSAPVPVPARTGYKVDVFVTTYNEPVSLLTHTLHAAVGMDYDHETWLLDDGNNPEMAGLARRLGCRYVTRGDNRDAKAGNLNNALGLSTADFIAVFDADHVPNREFLTQTLGFLEDQKVAFVQTPQDFYNLDSYQHRRHRRLNYIWTEQSLFFRVIQRGKDRWNAAFFCGSCAVLRASALRQIGGFATGTITEDLHTSVRMHKKGYRSVYLPQSLAYGLAPDSIDGFLSQRLRWGEGAIQVWRKEGILFSRGLTLAQRLNYLASVLTYFDGWSKAVFYVAPVIVLTTGIMPIAVFGWSFVWHFLPFYVLCFWSFEEIARGYGRTLLTEEYNMARFAVFIRATLGGLRRHISFRVTPKQASGKRERRHMLPQMAVVSASALAIVIGAVLWTHHHYLARGAFVANLIWASVNLGLAGVVVRFTVRRKHRRQDYRFPIPLPIEMAIGNGSVALGLAEDISSSGCRLVLEQELAQKSVSGRIYLPAGVSPFDGIIQHHDARQSTSRHRFYRTPASSPARPSREKHHYGLTFSSESEGAAMKLEDFLYGSDLQWRVLDLHEEITTPIAWIVDRFSEEGRQRRAALVSPEEWLPVICRRIGEKGDQGQLGILARSDWTHQPARLITFGPLIQDAEVELSIFGLATDKAPRGHVEETVVLPSLAAPIHISQISITRRQDGSVQTRQNKAPGLMSSVKSVLPVLFVSLITLALLFPGTASAAGWLGLAGAEAGENHNAYAYVGAILPLGGQSELGNGWVQRYWLDWVRYRFNSDGTETQARAPGLSASFGRQGSDGDWHWGIYGGAGYRDTRLSPDNPSARMRGSQIYPLLAMDLSRYFAAKWRMDAAASFTFSPASYWSRVRVLHRLEDGVIYHGIELVEQGDRDYHEYKVGYVIDGLKTSRSGSIGVKIGMDQTSGLAAGAYAGIEYVYAFRGY